MITLNIYYWQIPFLVWWTTALAVVSYRRWLTGKLGIANKLMTSPLLIAFATLDVAINWTVLLLTMGISPMDTYTISDRFALYRSVLKGQTAKWKIAIADAVCFLLDQFDEGHC